MEQGKQEKRGKTKWSVIVMESIEDSIYVLYKALRIWLLHIYIYKHVSEFV